MQSGTNLPKVKDYNQGVVLETIRLGKGISRIEVAEQTGLNPQTVSNIVKRLIQQNLVVENGKGESIGGKRRVKLGINPEAGYSIGVQLDGDEALFVIVDLEGRVVAEDRHPTLQERGPTGVIDQIAASVEQLVQGSDLGREKILGMGVACTGLIDHLEGVVYKPTNLLGWHQVPLKQLLEQETGYEVVVDNDATAAAVGERWSGDGQGASNMAFIYMGVGVGAGLFVDNRVYRGRTTSAGEFGHVTLNPEGPECFCGSCGCVEVYCAPKSVVLAVSRRLRQGESSLLSGAFFSGAENVSFSAVRQAALEGDTVALEEIERSAWLLGCAVVSLVNLLDLELIALGGKAFKGIEYIYREQVEQVVAQRTIARERGAPKVAASEFGENAGAVGAAALVLHKVYAPRLGGLRKGP